MASTKRNGSKRGLTKRRAANAPKERPQQFYDRIALGLALLGIVALVSLTVPNSGVVGATLRDGLRLLFGSGAFLLPMVLWLAAGALVFGYGKLALPEVLGGGLIVYLALLGWLAQPGETGQWSEADALRASGGYLGAVLGYMLQMALGQAKGVVLSVLGVLGLLMLFNLPLAQVFRGVGRALVRLARRIDGDESGRDGDRQHGEQSRRTRPAQSAGAAHAHARTRRREPARERVACPPCRCAAVRSRTPTC